MFYFATFKHLSLLSDRISACRGLVADCQQLEAAALGGIAPETRDRLEIYHV